MDGYTIRPAEKGEMRAIRALIRKRPDVLAQKRLPDRRSFFVAVTLQNKIVGCAAIQIHDGEAEFRSLFVSPDHNGHNLGQSLWEACRKKAKKRYVKQVRLMTAIPEYFQELGFRPEETGKIAMVLDLANGDTVE